MFPKCSFSDQLISSRTHIQPGMTHGTPRTLHVQLYSEFTTHYTWSLVLNLVPGIVSGRKGTARALHVQLRRCDERLKTQAEESTRVSYTGLVEELEHLKIKTRLIDEKFASVMGECVI